MNKTPSKKFTLVSVIIPTRNSEKTIKKCLLSVKSQEYKNVETIVIDRDSTDKTKSIAWKYSDKVLNKGPERSAQRNYGVQKAKGNFVLIVDSDMELSSLVIKEAVEKISNNKNINY